MRNRQTVLIVLCAVFFAAAVCFGLLWRQARTDSVMAHGAEATAQTELAAAEARAEAALALETALAETQAELDSVKRALAEAEALSYEARLRQSVAENHTITVHAASEERGALPYLLYEPHGLDEDEPLPLLVYLHGTRERGSDPLRMYDGGSLPGMLRDGLLTPNALVLMPQCPENETWFTRREALKTLIDAVAAESNADLSRISITGFSMGGIGVLIQLTEYPAFYAAAAPVAATYPPSACSVITSTPVRMLHGSEDTGMGFDVVEINRVINAAGGQSELRIYSGEGHLIQYHYLDDGGALVDWLIAQKRTD